MSGRHKQGAKDPAFCTLPELCNYIVTSRYPLEDIVDHIEERVYLLCDEGKGGKALEQLKHVVKFYEQLEQKNEEVCRSLVDILFLIGEVYQHSENYAESIKWFEKVIIVNDRYYQAFHSMAESFLNMGNLEKAVKCFRQEIQIEPGNYYTYLLLADLYEKLDDENSFEKILRDLLARSPENIRALHRLINHFEEKNPHLEVKLLRKRLLSSDNHYTKTDLIIWVYHMCKEKKHEEALKYLETETQKSPVISIVHLLKAFIYGEMKRYRDKRSELVLFKEKSNSMHDVMNNRIREFEAVFGSEAALAISKMLTVSHART